MLESNSKWFLVCALLGAALLVGCPPDGADGEGGGGELPVDADALQCLRWESACGGECVDRQTNIDHCGECGRSCDSAQLCSQGSCVDSCPEGFEQCGDACVDLMNSEEHCGQCDNRCLTDGAEGYCSAGSCDSWICRPMRRDDDGDRSDGCERSCAGFEFGSSQNWDVQIDVHDVRGTLTVGGEAPAGREVGALVFESLDTDAHVYTPVFPQEDHNYRLNLYPGLYTVRLIDDNVCNPRYSSCPGPVVRDVVEITGDQTIDMQLDEDNPFPGNTVQVTGEIAIDSEPLADQPQSNYRARVTFAGTFEHHRFFVNPEGPATFQGQLPAGTYRVSVVGFNCTQQAMPCQEKIVDPEMTLTSDTDFDWDFETVEFSGTITANGAQLTDSATGNARGQLDLEPADDSVSGSTSAPLPPTGPVEYSVRVYPGTYHIRLRNRQDCPGDGTEAIPCSTRLIERDVDMRSDTKRDIDIETVVMDGTVTLNGREMLDSPATQNRGMLEFVSPEGTHRVGFGAAGPVEYGIKMYPGSYDVIASNPTGCQLSRPVIPCQEKSLGRIEVLEDRTYDVDLEVVSLTGELTIDGQPFPDVDNRSRGTVRVQNDEAQEAASSDLGSRGPAEFNARIFADEGYQVTFAYECYGDNSILPCGTTTLAASVDLNDDRSLRRDLRVARISGSLTVNEQPLSTLEPPASLVLRNADTHTTVPFGEQTGARFDAMVYPGTYRVEYSSPSHQCQGELPCGTGVVREEFTARDGAQLDVSLDAIELEGEVDYRGIGRTANGDLSLVLGNQDIRVPVQDGRYGPTRVLDAPYLVHYFSDSCRQADDVPCMPYVVAGCD